jgi:peptidoglycan/xylan/chitin deacetylase (PgdA/CDA1 family)
MKNSINTLRVVQCWDDGITADIRLTDILRKYGAKASFNLNAGRHEEKKKSGWTFKETEVWRLGWEDMQEVYDGFTIANHTLTHPFLTRIPIEEASKNVTEGRDRLQQFFQAPVLGFAYPCGAYDEKVMDAVQEAGHIYARTTKNADQCFPPENAMAFHSNCHFLAPDFYERYEASRKCGVFYFWGHSYEMITEEMWTEFEKKIAFISADTTAAWADLPDLFA